MHRFVLHGLAPFSRWHAQHHQRPAALICSPTVFSALLIATLVFAPVLLALGVAHGSAFSLGVLAGYLAYTVTHHATHLWRAQAGWLKRRKLSHTLHHHDVAQALCFGVSTSFWDHVFRTGKRRDRRAVPGPLSNPPAARPYG